MALRLSLSILGTYNWTRQLIYSIFSRTEKEALLKQVEELRVQLQREKENGFLQEQKITEVSTNLESEVTENQSLWNQVEYLTNELHRAKTWAQQQSNLFRKERAKCFEEQTLRIQLGQELEETKKLLAYQKTQEELMVNKAKKTSSELETLKVSYQKLHQKYDTCLEKQTLRLQLAKELEDTKKLLAYQKTQEELLVNKAKETSCELETLKVSYQKLHQKYETCLEEQTLRIQLGKELEDTKKLLAYQKTQEELLVNKAKETSSELETLKVSYQELHQRYETCLEEQTLRIQLGKELEETKKVLAYQKTQEELLVNKAMETSCELETLKVSYQELHQRYETDLRAEKQKSDTFQQQLDGLKAEQGAFQQKLVLEINLLQQDAAKKATTFSKELKALKTKLQEKTSANVEEEVNQALHTETPQLVDTLTDDVCEKQEQKEEESLPNLQESEILEAQEPEQEAPEKKKKPSLWKRTRHFLGLRKTKRKRQEESTHNEDSNN